MLPDLSKKLSRIGDIVGQLSLSYDGRNLTLVILAVVTGGLCGTAAWVLKFCIGWVSRFLTAHLHAASGNWIFLILPFIGIALAALYQRYILKRQIYHGVLRLNNNLVNQQYNLPSSQMISPIIASTFTLGFGGSAGSEGPIAYTGAALGSNVGKLLRVDSQIMKVLVAAGAAAGIAGIFKAPIGGALFALEVLTVELNVAAVVAIVAACVVSGLTAFTLSGFTPDIHFAITMPFEYKWMWAILAFGVFAGLYSTYYAAVMGKMSLWYEKRAHTWIKVVVSGAIIGLAVLLFPPLYGEGYTFISSMLATQESTITQYGFFAHDMITPELLMLMSGGIILVKPWATSSTTSGGGVAGDFAPSLFAGCLTGVFFAICANALFHCDLPVGYFAFFGMGAVMAATQRAPLMAIFLTIEMGMAFKMLLPVVVCSVVSYIIFRITVAVLKIKDT